MPSLVPDQIILLPCRLKVENDHVMCMQYRCKPLCSAVLPRVSWRCCLAGAYFHVLLVSVVIADDITIPSCFPSSLYGRSFFAFRSFRAQLLGIQPRFRDSERDSSIKCWNRCVLVFSLCFCW